MVELKYVKKRKRRKRAAIIASASSAGILAMGIIAFLGRNVGSFTVALNNDTVKLSLSTSSAPTAERSTFLYVDKLYPFEQTTYANLPADDVLDNEDYSTYMDEAINYTKDGTPVSMNFMKYTFYVNNEGSKVADYEMHYNIVSDVKANDGRDLIDTLRVMIYENDVATDSSVTHDKTIYAKAPDTGRVDEDGNVVNKEYVSTPVSAISKKNNFYGFAEPFTTDPYSGKVTGITTIESPQLGLNMSRRYTLVVWLEGQDLSETIKRPPEGASIKLGISINAYESK